MKTYNMKEASELLGVTYRTIRYYKDKFNSEVFQDGRDVQLTERFIQLVQHNIETNRPNKDISDKKTKKEYREELEALNDKYKKAIQEQRDIYEDKLGVLSELDYDADIYSSLVNTSIRSFERARFNKSLKELDPHGGF